jgi:chorismate dehydratase
MIGSSEPLRVGRIPFLVCAPYFHASLQGLPGVTFTDGPPRALNGLLASGAIEAAPSSSFEYARNPDAYMLLRGLCTSGRGEVKSVLLFSREPWEKLDGKRIALSPDSDTSNALVRVLSRFRFGVDPEFVDAGKVPGEEIAAKAAGREIAAKAAIGDAALREAATGDWPYRYDLARVWTEWRGTPLPFGVWILRREAARRAPAAVAAYARHLRESLASFFAAPAARLEAWGGAYTLPLSSAAALDFFSTADYVLTDSHARALQDFFGMCAELGLIPKAPGLEWFEENEK